MKTWWIHTTWPSALVRPFCLYRLIVTKYPTRLLSMRSSRLSSCIRRRFSPMMAAKFMRSVSWKTVGRLLMKKDRHPYFRLLFVHMFAKGLHCNTKLILFCVLYFLSFTFEFSVRSVIFLILRMVDTAREWSDFDVNIVVIAGIVWMLWMKMMKMKPALSQVMRKVSFVDIF